MRFTFIRIGLCDGYCRVRTTASSYLEHKNTHINVPMLTATIFTSRSGKNIIFFMVGYLKAYIEQTIIRANTASLEAKKKSLILNWHIIFASYSFENHILYKNVKLCNMYVSFIIIIGFESAWRPKSHNMSSCKITVSDF